MTVSIGRTVIGWAVAAVLLATAGGLVGAFIAQRPDSEMLALQLRSERAARSQSFNEWEAQLQAAQRSTEHVQGDLVVERSARAELERNLVATQAELDRARDQLAFYEQLLPPGPQGSVALRAVDLQLQAGALRYRVLLMRSGKPGERFSGLLEFVAIGQQDGQEVTHILKPLLTAGQSPNGATVTGAQGTAGGGTDPAADALRLGFEQFQRSQGLLALPAGFAPQSVTVRVVEGSIVLASRRVDL